MNKNFGFYTMNPLNEPQVLYDKSFFETLLDNTFTRLHDVQARHSIKRLGELEMILKNLETELDAFIPLAAENVNAKGSACSSN